MLNGTFPFSPDVTPGPSADYSIFRKKRTKYLSDSFFSGFYKSDTRALPQSTSYIPTLRFYKEVPMGEEVREQGLL